MKQSLLTELIFTKLGVNRTATSSQINKAFHKLSLTEHPDKKGGIQTERWDLIKKAKGVLTEHKAIYDNLIDNEGLLNKTNNGKFRNKIINFLKKKIVFYAHGSKRDGTTKYLPAELRNWETEINNAIYGVSYEAINSYAALLVEVFGSVISIETNYKDKPSFNLSRVVNRFANLQSKNQIEQTYNNIVEEFTQGGGGARNKGLKKLEALPGFAELISSTEKEKYRQEIRLATDSWVIDNIIKKVKERLEHLREEKKKNDQLDPEKKKLINELHNLNGWNELLEPWEQDHLEEKVNSTTDKTFFNGIRKYVRVFIQGGHLRKYKAKFWEDLKNITSLKKESIRQDDGSADGAGGDGYGERGKKVGERYEDLRQTGCNPEPLPHRRIEGEQLVEMKLFIHYFWGADKTFNWPFLLPKINKYGADVDSGWRPSKRTDKPKPKKPQDPKNPAKNQTHIDEIKGFLKLSEKSLAEQILGKNWEKALRNADGAKEISKIKNQLEDRIANHRSGIPNPAIDWLQKTPPPADLQAIKDAAKQEILQESFNKEPVIDGSELEKINQNWESDIENSSKEEEINFIKERVLADIRNKRANKDKGKKISILLDQAKQEENWNDYEKLEAILKQIKELRSSNAYKEKESEILEVESQLQQLNPDKFRETTKDNLEDQKKNAGLTDVSDETQKAIDEALRTGDLAKKKQAEEMIAKDEAKKKLDDVIIIVKKELGRKNLTKEEKKELLQKLLQIIVENDYQKDAYQSRKSEVDALLAELQGDKKNQEKPGISWPKKIGIAALIVSPLMIIAFVILRVRRRKLREKID